MCACAEGASAFSYGQPSETTVEGTAFIPKILPHLFYSEQGQKQVKWKLDVSLHNPECDLLSFNMKSCPSSVNPFLVS